MYLYKGEITKVMPINNPFLTKKWSTMAGQSCTPLCVRMLLTSFSSSENAFREEEECLEVDAETSQKHYNTVAELILGQSRDGLINHCIRYEEDSDAMQCSLDSQKFKLFENNLIKKGNSIEMLCVTHPMERMISIKGERVQMRSGPLKKEDSRLIWMIKGSLIGLPYTTIKNQVSQCPKPQPQPQLSA